MATPMAWIPSPYNSRPRPRPTSPRPLCEKNLENRAGKNDLEVLEPPHSLVLYDAVPFFVSFLVVGGVVFERFWGVQTSSFKKEASGALFACQDLV